MMTLAQLALEALRAGIQGAKLPPLLHPTAWQIQHVALVNTMYEEGRNLHASQAIRNK